MVHKEDLQKLETNILKKVEDLLIETQKKDWLSEEDIRREFGISRQTMKRYRDDPVDPLPYTRFSADGKFVYYHRRHINKRLLNNMVGLTPREKKAQEDLIIGG